MRALLVSALLALGACSQSDVDSQSHAPLAPWLQTQATLPDGGPPVDADGFFDGVGSCPGESCEVVPWHIMQEPVPLHAEPNRTAPVIATLSAGEWVRAGQTVHRWRPLRGVVVGDVQNVQNEGARMAVGDVVYTIDYEGEGFLTLWRRGEILSWYHPGDESDVVDGIRWEPHDEAQHAADQTAGGGWWIQMQREDGQMGWMLGEHLTCWARDLTDECRARNPPPQ